ncbi:hypothetical protein Bbelb_259200 [Branchiostoma belcheri]|nr:hypothetical protein Bbelb_259200 [Branchiostoma belcheri]
MPPRLSDKLGKGDIQRAMVCCQAIYQDGRRRSCSFSTKQRTCVCTTSGKSVCPGTESYEDILSDLHLARLYRRACDSWKVPRCMGGAVAHIVTLNLLADLQRCNRATENVLSIAIGAPFFGDREMRKYAEKHGLSDNC